MGIERMVSYPLMNNWDMYKEILNEFFWKMQKSAFIISSDECIGWFLCEIVKDWSQIQQASWHPIWFKIGMEDLYGKWEND